MPSPLGRTSISSEWLIRSVASHWCFPTIQFHLYSLSSARRAAAAPPSPPWTTASPLLISIYLIFTVSWFVWSPWTWWSEPRRRRSSPPARNRQWAAVLVLVRSASGRFGHGPHASRLCVLGRCWASVGPRRERWWAEEKKSVFLFLKNV
jgi:heme A synthase